jgi:hypothetical protein
MLKCDRCGKYYIPGYLACACQTTLLSLRQASVSALPMMMATLDAARFMHPMVPEPDASKPSEGSITGERTNRSAAAR